MHLALFVGVVVACATVAMAEVGEEPAPPATLALTTSTVKTTPITQIHPTKATTTTTAAPIIAIAMADAPKLADTTKAPTTTAAPKPAETTTTTTATTDTPKRWSRNPLLNTTTTEVPTTVIATTIAPPTTTVVTTKVPATTTTDKLTPTMIDKPRYRRSEPVITTTIKPKALLPTKPESNETLWFAATKSDDEWKNATFASERKHGENGTDEWEGADENREEITIAIIEKFERTTILHKEGPGTNETIVVIKKDDLVDAPKAEEKEKEADTDTDDDDDDDDDDLPKGASLII